MEMNGDRTDGILNNTITFIVAQNILQHWNIHSNTIINTAELQVVILTTYHTESEES